jgi:hypothetical protein
LKGGEMEGDKKVRKLAGRGWDECENVKEEGERSKKMK